MRRIHGDLDPARSVSKFFGDADNGSTQVVAVKDVSLDVKAGEFFSIIGPSGCGVDVSVNHP